MEMEPFIIQLQKQVTILYFTGNIIEHINNYLKNNSIQFIVNQLSSGITILKRLELLFEFLAEVLS